MEYFKKILSWLLSAPKWAKIICSFVVAILLAVYLLCSCGLTRASIKTSADNTASTITITTNNPTSVSLQSSVDSTKFNFKK